MRISAHVDRNDDLPVFLTAISSEFAKHYAASERASKQYLVVFTSSLYEHDAGARLWLRGCPCEGSRAGPEIEIQAT